MFTDHLYELEAPTVLGHRDGSSITRSQGKRVRYNIEPGDLSKGNNLSKEKGIDSVQKLKVRGRGRGRGRGAFGGYNYWS